MGTLDGKVALITGGNSGIGLETAVALARDGAHVVITSRDATRGANALSEIESRSGKSAEVMALDLASFASVRAFVPEFTASHDRLDILVDNAGVILRDRRVTVDGHETQFQTNHLGPFLLTNLFREQLVATAPARVVVVASDAHRWAWPIDDDLESAHRYRAFRVYGRTKLMNLLFTRELARRLEGTGVTVNAVHPGYVATRFSRDGDTGFMGNVGMVLGRPFAKSPEVGAQTSVFVASAPQLEGVTGQYFAKSRLAKPAKSALDDAAASRLWAVSEALTAAPD